MDRNLATRLGVIVFVLVVCLYLLYPTIVYFSHFKGVTPDDVSKLSESERHRYESVVDKSMKLGLDLQGGMHLVLQMDDSKHKIENKKDAQDRVLEIFRTRIDKFGVTEPSISKQGDDRINIQLPGVGDPERVRNIIQATAQLKFQMAREQRELVDTMKRIDDALKAAPPMPAKPDTTKGKATATAATGAPVASADSTHKAAGDSLFPELATPKATETPAIDKEHLFTSQFLTLYQGGLVVPDDGVKVDRVKQMLQNPAAQAVIPKSSEFVWSSEPGPRTQDGLPTRLLYLLNTKAELTGETLEDARVTPDPDRPGGMQINFRLSRRGARLFGRVTGENVGKQMAIVLDGVVKSAPSIKNKIPNGEAVITGSYTDQQARDLAIVLRAGALPVDVKFIEERTIGPTLGSDSLRQGVRASVIGLALVALFLTVYYSLSGLLASVGLVFNLVVVAACMAALHAALSLPGIAGMVLSVAMAVDANVLIFERIREELRKSKTVNAAIDAGYKHAFSAIFDSHVTTLCSGIVLFYFGTGTIKGYATTLSIGIVSSLFTSLFVTRWVYDFITRRRKLQTLSIG